MPLDSSGSELTVSEEQVSDRSAMQVSGGIAPKRVAGYVEEAPIDGEIYARKDAAWLRIEIVVETARDVQLVPPIAGHTNLHDLLEGLASTHSNSKKKHNE